MIWMLLDVFFISFGSFSFFLLFYYFPKLSKSREISPIYPRFSIIIPARNEEQNLKLLLADLNNQSLKPSEVICVDDASSDKTADVVLSFGCKLISVVVKPEGWLGKSWACQMGSEAATTDLYLFLDADVRIGRNGLKQILDAYLERKQTISVQPYHQTKTFYEQFSLIFNLLQFAANGNGLPWARNLGLYGPVILINKADYQAIGGHVSVRSSIVEDVDLGLALRAADLPFEIYVGNRELSYRMYSDGFMSLCRGWMKNIATGARKTAPLIFVMVFVWITALTTVPLHWITAVREGDGIAIVVFSILYLIYAFFLRYYSKQLGDFKWWASAFYPLVLSVFLFLFLGSTVLKIFGVNVKWKGRRIPGGGSR